MAMRDITRERTTDGRPNVRKFHQAKWDEPIIFELSVPGTRGILVPEVEADLRAETGDVLADLPESMRRKEPPALPELSQVSVVRHYLRLSQETIGADLNVDIGQGTCTMKHNPKVNDQLAASPKLMDLHPLQDEETVQGILEVMYRFGEILQEISGLDQFSLQPGAGSAAIYANVSMIRAYHEANGEGEQRDEIITTMFSHPSNAACAKTAGYKVITLHPDADGYPDFEALEAAISNRTAALLITNPEDTGIFNPRIAEFVDLVHEAGGLCSYDQANANGILGITRAREANFDLCHFNLHKTFSTPHACGGPAVGATGVRGELTKFLPLPVIKRDGDRYRLDYGRPDSVGKVGSFHGVPANVVRAYTWVMNLGADGLREVAEIAVLNNNYLLAKMLEIPGLSVPYAEGKRRIEQVRYSWEKLTEETGVHSEELGIRCADFGLHYWTSHHPFVVPEPCTLEPAESYSKADLDEYVGVIAHVVAEAYNNPEKVKTAPHNSSVHTIDHSSFDDPAEWAITWRMYRKKVGANA